MTMKTIDGKKTYIGLIGIGAALLGSHYGVIKEPLVWPLIVGFGTFAGIGFRHSLAKVEEAVRRTPGPR